MTFSDFKAHSNPIFKELKILKVEDSIHVLNCLFFHDYFNNKLPKPFISSLYVIIKFIEPCVHLNPVYMIY